MNEYAIFRNQHGAMALLDAMRARNVVPTLRTYESFFVAATRKRSRGSKGTVEEDEGSVSWTQLDAVVDEMKAHGLTPSVRVFNSLMRWGSGEEAVDRWWMRMRGEGVKPDLSTATVLMQMEMKRAKGVEGDPVVEGDARERLESAFRTIEGVERGEGVAVVGERRLSELVAEFTELVLKYTPRTDSNAAPVLIMSYLVSQNRIADAVALLPRIQSLRLPNSSRIYGELLKGALVAGDESLVQQVSDSMVQDGVEPDKYIYHQLIKADFQRRKFQDGLKLLDGMLNMSPTTARPRQLNHDDVIVADLISELGAMGEYDMIFHVYDHIKQRDAGFSMGPLVASNLLTYTTPILGQDAYRRVEIPAAPTTTNPQHPTHPVSFQFPTARRKQSFYPPISPFQLLSEYTSQPTPPVLDHVICSAAICALIKSNLPAATVLPSLFQKFESCGTKLTPLLLCYTAEAFASTKNLEGIQWVLRLLQETGSELTSSTSSTPNLKEIHRRIWMATLTCASRLGNVDAVESALRGLCLSSLPAALKPQHHHNHTTPPPHRFGINLDVLTPLDRTRTLRAIDALLAAKARTRDAHGVRSLVGFMHAQGAVPSLEALRVVCLKGLEGEVDALMGVGWVRGEIGKAGVVVDAMNEKRKLKR
ncbi:hypothetical protein HDU98_000787 [Podochytrium sp. JEL0797]|nr:hypothetical protein HDU98_000787 [Podochytrium sp. JEL0797]